MSVRTLHELKESAKRMFDYFKFKELQEIPHCMFYDYDTGAFEEYCICPEIDRTKNTKDFESEKECWQCSKRIEKGSKEVS